jgi:hypothetical protein
MHAGTVQFFSQPSVLTGEEGERREGGVGELLM